MTRPREDLAAQAADAGVATKYRDALADAITKVDDDGRLVRHASIVARSWADLRPSSRATVRLEAAALANVLDDLADELGHEAHHA